MKYFIPIALILFVGCSTPKNKEEIPISVKKDTVVIKNDVHLGLREEPITTASIYANQASLRKSSELLCKF